MTMEAGGLVEQRRERVVVRVNNGVIRKKRSCERRTKRVLPTVPMMTLQKLFVSCRDVFKGPGTVPFPRDVHSLSRILDSMRPEDVGLIIPLHNHPGMTVFSKLLLGRMHIKSYDWVDPVDLDASVPSSPLRLARLKANSVFTASSDTSVLYPTSGGNIHSFTAITPCAVLDVLGPPYSKDDGRDCTYYKDFSYTAFSNGETAVAKDGEGYGWLEEIEMPEESQMEWVDYLGPEVIESSC